MADFADQISDDHAARRLGRAIQGWGAFRRFKDELHQEYPQLLSVWYAFATTEQIAARSNGCSTTSSSIKTSQTAFR